LIESEERKYR